MNILITTALNFTFLALFILSGLLLFHIKLVKIVFSEKFQVETK